MSNVFKSSLAAEEFVRPEKQTKITLLSSTGTWGFVCRGTQHLAHSPKTSFGEKQNPLKPPPPYTVEKVGLFFRMTVPSCTISRSNSNWYQAVWTWRAFWLEVKFYINLQNPLALVWLPGKHPATAVFGCMPRAPYLWNSLWKNQSGQSPLTSALCCVLWLAYTTSTCKYSYVTTQLISSLKPKKGWNDLVTPMIQEVWWLCAPPPFRVPWRTH